MAHSDDNLARLLSEKFEIRVTVSDIKKCDQDMVQKIYIHFVRELGVPLEQIYAMPFGVSEAMQLYPDMYRTARHTMSLAKVIKNYLFTIFGEDSFMTSDLYDPKPKRTRQFFWLLLEFISQSGEQMNEIEDQVTIKQEKQQEMLDNIRELQEKLQQQKLEKAEHKITEEEEGKRIAEDSARLQECQDMKNKLRSELEKRKLASVSLSTATKEAELEVIQGNQRVKELCNLVVEDSERVEIQERENQLAELKSGVQEKKDRIAQIQQNSVMLKQYTDVLTMMAVLRDIQQENDKEKVSFATLNQVSQEQSAVQEQREDRNMQIQHLNQKIDLGNTKVSQILHTWSMKKESVFEEIKQHKETLEELRRYRTETEIANQDMENEYSRITGEITKVGEETIKIEDFIISRYRKIRHVMEERNQILLSSLTEEQQFLEQYRVE